MVRQNCSVRGSGATRRGQRGPSRLGLGGKHIAGKANALRHRTDEQRRHAPAIGGIGQAQRLFHLHQVDRRVQACSRAGPAIIGGQGVFGTADDEYGHSAAPAYPADCRDALAARGGQVEQNGIGLILLESFKQFVSCYEFLAVADSFRDALNPRFKTLSCCRAFRWTSFRVIPMVIPRPEWLGGVECERKSRSDRLMPLGPLSMAARLLSGTPRLRGSGSEPNAATRRVTSFTTVPGLGEARRS